MEVFTPESVALMGRQLIENYLLLSQEDLHLWETSPEDFGKFLVCWLKNKDNIEYYIVKNMFLYFLVLRLVLFLIASEEGGEAWKYSLRVLK